MPRRRLKELDLYRPVRASGPVGLGWRGGLGIEARGAVFTQTVTRGGEVTFRAE